jgi:hypothetical protein
MRNRLPEPMLMPSTWNETVKQRFYRPAREHRGENAWRGEEKTKKAEPQRAQSSTEKYHRERTTEFEDYRRRERRVPFSVFFPLCNSVPSVVQLYLLATF